MLTERWIRTGFVAGILTVLVYPLLITVPMPVSLTLSMAGAFGCFFIVATIGLYHFVCLERKTVSLQIGVVFNIIAGAMVTAMLFTQMAIRLTLSKMDEAATAGGEVPAQIAGATHSVQLGLDVVWDLFVCLGTFLIAANMRRHSRLGKLLSYSGMAVATALLAFNVQTFPTPPGEAGLVDLGPLLGVWYLLVTVRVGLSLNWVKQQVHQYDL